MRVAPAIELSSEARLELEKLSRRRTTAVRVALRSRIVLLAADGMGNKEIAQQLAVAPRMAALWRGRFIELGIAGSDEGCSPAGTDTGHFCADGRRSDCPDDADPSPTEPRIGRAAGWRARWAFPSPAWAASGALTD